MNERLPKLLVARLARPLPGPMVGTRFEPQPPVGRRCDSPPPDARDAAVLVLLYLHRGQWHLPLTLRPSHLAAHGGQVSLPGGAVEPGETSRQAAIREFHEELGGQRQPIEILGRLSPVYVSASNFLVTPWVAATDGRPELIPNPDEVEELLEVLLVHLLEQSNFGSHQRQYQGCRYTVPHFICEPHRIWGATCMILGELVTVLEEVGWSCG